MKYSALFCSVLCLGSLELACGISLRSSDASGLQQQFQSSTFLSMQQQFQLISAGAAAAHQRSLSAVAPLPPASSKLNMLPAGVAAKQPHKLEKAPHLDQKVSLLTVVKSFQGEHARETAKTSGVKSMPSNMGELKQRLGSWENAQHQLEQQVASQQQAFELSQAADFNNKEDMLAVKVWCKRKVLGCSALSIAIAICFISAMSQNKKKKAAKLEAIDTSSLNELSQAMAKQPLLPEPEASEMSKTLADLAELIGKVKMPSEGSFQVAEWAMDARKAEDVSIGNAPEPVSSE